MTDPTARFSDRVADYVRYRPDYPAAVVDTLTTHCGWKGPVDVADLGSGTGLSALALLNRGHRVFAVEPNGDMRAAAEHLLQSYKGFVSVAGRAEATGLPDASVDLVLCAQAFHWFDVALAAAETRRILRPTGHAALLWNLRRRGGSAFLDAYEALLREFAKDYAAIAERYAESASMQRYFAPQAYRSYRFDHVQHFDFQGLQGRLLSSSYTPAPDQPRHAAMLSRLREIFASCHVDGRVAFAYDTYLFLGLR